MRQEFFHNENRHSRFINRVSRWPGVNRAFALMKVKDARGYSLLELLIVMGMISVIAAIAVPRLLRARISSNEASAIGSMRTISSAQAAFAASCGGGGYAITVADLALPPTGGGQAFIPVDLAAATSGGTKSGYTFTITGATGGSRHVQRFGQCFGNGILLDRGSEPGGFHRPAFSSRATSRARSGRISLSWLT